MDVLLRVIFDAIQNGKDVLEPMISEGWTDVTGWINETASPAIQGKFNEYKEKLNDPETQKNAKEWFTEKYDAMAEFTKEEILAALKKTSSPPDEEK